MGCPTNMGLLIREAGDSCGDEVVSAADATGDGGGLEDDDSPGPEVVTGWGSYAHGEGSLSAQAG